MLNSMIMGLSLSLVLIKLHSKSRLSRVRPRFFPNPSFKSTFAQNESCRSSFPLQLLFWSNFKLPYKNLTFGRSTLGQNSFETSLFLFLFSPEHAHTATGDAPATPRVSRPYPFPALLLPRARAESSPSSPAAERPCAGLPSPPRCDSSRPRPPRFAPHLLHSS